MGSGTISLPSSGCFSPFPHGTRSLSVSREYLALPDGPGGFTQDSSCPALLRIPLDARMAPRTGLSPSAARRSRHLRSPHAQARRGPTTPDGPRDTDRFGLLPVRSPLLGESLLFSLPAGTKMFQFPALAPTVFTAGDRPSGGRVVPFGNPGVKGHLLLTRAYRSLSRPSSPP